MMHIFLNALGANTASGLTYLRNVLPQLAARVDVKTTVAVHPRLSGEFRNQAGVSLADVPRLNGSGRRFWFEQRRLPILLRDLRVDVLISAGNFAIRKSSVPQILLSGNSLYISRDFHNDLLARGEYALWVDTRVKAVFAKKSIHWADRTVAPTQAFADELRRWTGKPVNAIHHGFDRGIFFGDQAPLPPAMQSQLDSAKDALKLLYVSHYNYFRNFETLFRAVPLIREKAKGKAVRLFLTCKLEPGENPGSYKTEPALLLIKKLGIENEIAELGAVPYRQLHHLYRSCDIYVAPSYAETFAHPLVEAMACRLPVVASDLAVHREVCGASVRYFSSFSPEELADQVLRAAVSESDRQCSAQVPFSWRAHVDQLLDLAKGLVPGRVAAAA